MFEAFDRAWHAGLFHKPKSYEISVQIFGLISSFLSEKPSKEYPFNDGDHQGSILGPTLFLLYINDIPDDVICNTAIYADDTTLYTKCADDTTLYICGNNLNWLLNLNLIYETLWTGAESGLLILMLEKLNSLCLTGLITLIQLM